RRSAVARNYSVRQILCTLTAVGALSLMKGGVAAQSPAEKPKQTADQQRHDSLMRLHPMIRPRGGEAAWSNIAWITDLWEARKKAAAEGKPIFVWSAEADPMGCT